MGIFSKTELRSIGDIGQPLLPSRADARQTAGVIVTPDTAMTLGAVWACVRLRADLVSTLPLDAYRMVGGQPVPMDAPPLLANPGGQGVSTEDWFYQTQVSLDLRGNAFGVVATRDGMGYPTQIELVHPDLCRVSRNADGELVYRIAGSTVATADVYHERQFLSPGNPLGLSPVTYAARSMGMALAAEKFGADWFQDGAHPSSVLTTDQKIDESQARTIKNRFIEAVRGNREPVVLGAGIKYQAISVAANESQFLEAMRWGVQQIARVYGVPAELIGGDTARGMAYVNVEQRSSDFLTYGIGPTLTRRERAFSRLLPPRQEVRYNLKALLRADAETRFKTHAIGIAGKFLTPDEARHEENMPPLNDEQQKVLDLIPLTVTPMGAVKVLPPGAPPKTSPAVDTDKPELAPSAQLAAPDVHMHFGDISATPTFIMPSRSAVQTVTRDADGNIERIITED